MVDQDDVRFSSFTRDLARRHRRPRSYPPSPIRSDALEQLCGGATISGSDLPANFVWPDLSDTQLPDVPDFGESSHDLPS